MEICMSEYIGGPDTAIWRTVGGGDNDEDRAPTMRTEQKRLN